MVKTIKNVFTESYHGLCIFHIMQNTIKHLSVKGQEEKDEGEGDQEDEEPHILFDFSACMYGFVDKEAFWIGLIIVF